MENKPPMSRQSKYLLPSLKLNTASKGTQDKRSNLRGSFPSPSIQLLANNSFPVVVVPSDARMKRKHFLILITKWIMWQTGPPAKKDSFKEICFNRSDLPPMTMMRRTSTTSLRSWMSIRLTKAWPPMPCRISISKNKLRYKFNGVKKGLEYDKKSENLEIFS